MVYCCPGLVQKSTDAVRWFVRSRFRISPRSHVEIDLLLVLVHVYEYGLFILVLVTP